MWWVTARDEPRTPKVKARFAAVLATAVISSAEKFGVEEPFAVLYQWQQAPGDIGSYRFEAALGVGEPRLQRRFEDEVVAARDEFTFGAAYDPGCRRQPGADGEIGMAGHQWCDKREQSVEVGRQIDIHVGDDLGVGSFPHRPQGTTAALGR